MNRQVVAALKKVGINKINRRSSAVVKGASSVKGSGYELTKYESFTEVRFFDIPEILQVEAQALISEFALVLPLKNGLEIRF